MLGKWSYCDLQTKKKKTEKNKAKNNFRICPLSVVQMVCSYTMRKHDLLLSLLQTKSNPKYPQPYAIWSKTVSLLKGIVVSTVDHACQYFPC